jgi:hypothetical protein
LAHLAEREQLAAHRAEPPRLTLAALAALAAFVGVPALEALREAVRRVVGHAVPLALDGRGRVAVGHAVEEALAEPGARARRVGGQRVREHDVLVDLGLQLELELGRRAAPLDAGREVHEMADALDDLAERVERRAREIELLAGQAGDAQLDLEVVLVAAHEHGLPLLGARLGRELAHVGERAEAVEPAEALLDPLGEGDLADEAGAVALEPPTGVGHWSACLPRGVRNPCAESAPASVSLRVLSQRS